MIDEKEKTSTNTMSSEKELLKKELDRPLYNVIKNSQAYLQIIETLDSLL